MKAQTVQKSSASNVTMMAKSKSSGTLVTPLRVPKPTFQFLDKDSQNQNKLSVTGPVDASPELPTFRIPHKSEAETNPPTSEVNVSLGHPGLPSCLRQMSSSLMQNSKSPTKMALKE